ncbi:MAG: murC [Gammaproteobacteria bacterium]|jgi:UDP-N-acetylmuramate--alanine ligase|nr:murC [Gammaproteobacteria bacterium]
MLLSWTLEMGRIKHIHFVGIGGVGMAGIAEVLLSQGYRVSGSDLSANSLTHRLSMMGAEVYHGHAAKNLMNADVVVSSSAVNVNNIELIRARELHIPIVPRAEMLGELMRFRYGIAIAGTHGKTTTTSLITSILTEEGVDPTFVIGGRLNSVGSNARLGTSRYIVAEADESDASFLYLKPAISVVTNVDADHMATYQNDFSQLRDAFLKFIHCLPFYGLVVLCFDDPVVRSMLSQISRPFYTYGLDEEAEFRATLICQTGIQTHFVVQRPHRSNLEVTLNLPGNHNVLNALAAIAVATELKVSDQAIQRALENFAGIGRRFQIYGRYAVEKGGHATLIDDYGHHPKEIAVTLQAARQSWPEKRIVMVYQPHRYTRTRDLFDDFCDVLSQSDVLILLDVYSAGESIISGADSPALVQAMNKRGKISPILLRQHEHLASVLQTVLCDGDILLMQGAGNIGALAAQLAATQEECLGKIGQIA